MTKKFFARLLLISGAALLILLFAWEAFAEDLSIVEVKSNIPLSDKDPVYHDYYINSGLNQGIKHNLVVTATRKVTIRDATGTQSYGDMMVPVGQLKVIFAGEKFSVARPLKQISREEQPLIDQTGFMIGDKIELKGSFVDNHKIPSQSSAAKVQVAPESASPAKALPAPPAGKEAAQGAPKPEDLKPSVPVKTETGPEKPEGEIDKTASVDDSST